MWKWIWWAPVLTFTGLAVLVHWGIAEPAPKRKPAAK